MMGFQLDQVDVFASYAQTLIILLEIPESMVAREVFVGIKGSETRFQPDNSGMFTDDAAEMTLKVLLVAGVRAPDVAFSR